MQLCDERHPRCQLKSEPTTPARLIEIADFEKGLLRLCGGIYCDGKYITLSYRWGDTLSSGYITTTKNVRSRRESFDLSSLPRTIQDAITVAHWLGVRHIWIDAMYVVRFLDRMLD